MEHPFKQPSKLQEKPMENQESGTFEALAPAFAEFHQRFERAMEERRSAHDLRIGRSSVARQRAMQEGRKDWMSGDSSKFLSAEDAEAEREYYGVRDEYQEEAKRLIAKALAQGVKDSTDAWTETNRTHSSGGAYARPMGPYALNVSTNYSGPDVGSPPEEASWSYTAYVRASPPTDARGLLGRLIGSKNQEFPFFHVDLGSSITDGQIHPENPEQKNLLALALKLREKFADK